MIGLGTPLANPTTGITFTAGSTSTFDLAGVLVSTNGRTGAVSAVLLSSAGITVSNAVAEVIHAIQPGLNDPSTPASLPAGAGLPPFGGPAVLTPNVALKGDFTIKIQEDHPDLFRDATQFNGPGFLGVFPNSPSADVQVMVQFLDIPTGLAITDCRAVLTNTFGNVSSGAPTVNFTNVTPLSPLLTVNFNAPLNLDSVDSLWVTCNVARGTATLPFPLTPVTAQATLNPAAKSTPRLLAQV